MRHASSKPRRGLRGNSLAGSPRPSAHTKLIFTDVPANHPFYSFIQKMRQLAVTGGCTASTYCPDDSTTRGQMSVFIVRGLLIP